MLALTATRATVSMLRFGADLARRQTRPLDDFNIELLHAMAIHVLLRANLYPLFQCMGQAPSAPVPLLLMSPGCVQREGNG
ncbi:MAG TPA: hypothetical protein VFU95_07720 [Telluria sp.]|nr:hypothetical protein [Telluria sp.]